MVVSTENASPLIEYLSTKRLRFSVLSQTEQRVREEALCGECALVARPDSAGKNGERRSQKHRRPPRTLLCAKKRQPGS